MKHTPLLLTLMLAYIMVPSIEGWFFESPEHPTRREDELTDMADINPEDLDDVQLFLTYKPFFLEYARQQMLQNRNQRNTRDGMANPFALRQRKDRRRR